MVAIVRRPPLNDALLRDGFFLCGSLYDYPRAVLCRPFAGALILGNTWRKKPVADGAIDTVIDALATVIQKGISGIAADGIRHQISTFAVHHRIAQRAVAAHQSREFRFVEGAVLIAGELGHVILPCRGSYSFAHRGNTGGH